MSFEAKRFRHVAVAIPMVAIAFIVTVSLCQQRTQLQQPDVAHHETLFGWRRRQPLDRGFGFGHVTVGPAI